MSEGLEECVPLLPVLKCEQKESPVKTEPPERPQSPESNCAICLEGFNNKSFTNSCLHEFCYLCLKEWSKVKPECPLCKQRFQTIIHSVRSPEDYDEYHVESHNPLDNVFFNFTASAGRFPYNNTLDFRERAAEGRDVYDRFMTGGETGVPSMLFVRQPRDVMLQRYHTSFLTLHNDYGANVTLRRDVYRHNRWIRPFTTPRVRESSPEFYRLNPAQTHRLVPWLFRELHVLLDVTIDPNAVLQEILILITIYPIRSRSFRDALLPTMGNHTDHFLHEFYHFAVSPHDIISYDIAADYDVPGRAVRCSPLRFNYLSSDDSDVEVVQPTRPKVEVGLLPNSCGLDLSNRAGPSSRNIIFQERSSPNQLVIEISDSSDSEVEIIHVRPPTPVTIIIESTESEEDVVCETVVDGGGLEERPLPSPSPSSSSRESTPPKPHLRPLKPFRRLSSTHSSSTSTTPTTSPRKRKGRKRLRRPPPSYSSTSSSDSESDSSSRRNRLSSSSRKPCNPVSRRRKLTALKPQDSSSEDESPVRKSRLAPRLRSVVNRVRSDRTTRSSK